MKQRERLLARAVRHESQARSPARRRTRCAKPPSLAGGRRAPVELVVVGDRARRADHAPHLARGGVDEDRRARAIVRSPGRRALAAAVGWQGVHSLLLVLVEVPVAALRDLDHEIGRGHAASGAPNCRSHRVDSRPPGRRPSRATPSAAPRPDRSRARRCARSRDRSCLPRAATPERLARTSVEVLPDLRSGRSRGSTLARARRTNLPRSPRSPRARA